jgi:mono/diheme cytochrome c family protein
MTGLITRFVGSFVAEFDIERRHYMKIRLGLILFLAFLVVPLFLLAFGSGDVAKGKELYSRCAVCHGDSGEGKEAIAKMFGVTMPPLASKEVQSLSDADLKKIIDEGKGKMRPVKMSDQEVADVIAFMRSLKK